MKKAGSATLRRAWPSADLSERLAMPGGATGVEPQRVRRSRSEKDYRVHKHKKHHHHQQQQHHNNNHLPPQQQHPFPPQYACQSPPAYVHPGDVSPISMSPISQSQFIPLGEVLLLAISAMNSAHKPVTQEALTDHLQTCFPGVPTPTEEVLHHTLSMLVRERKIYPTPDGYFIVTPQTYFITPSLIRTSSKWYHLDERLGATQHQQTQCTSPLSGTVTPSPSGGVVVGGRAHPKASQNHSGGGDSSYNNSYRDDPPSHHTTLQRRSPKDHRGEAVAPYPSPHPSPQTPPTTTATQQTTGGAVTTTEKSRSTLSFPFKTDTLTKHRGGGAGTETEGKGGSAGRKFGLKLFRLSFKKDKTKQLATFSAQFPPEEWPLRDEEVPSTLPRTVEMEIIRRINPDLTVENLARHTAVMKRLEEERAQRSKASSANQSSRSRRSGGRHRKPSQTKAARSHSKPRSSGRGGGGDPRTPGDDPAPGERDYRAYSSSLARSPREHAVAAERQRARLHLAHSNPNILDASAHLPVTPEWDVSGELAKRRTEMPFPEPSHGPSAHHSKERKSRGERQGDKAKERSRSMDNSKGPLGGVIGGLIGPPDYYEDRSRYYTDDGTLRAAAAATAAAANQSSSSHYSSRATPPSSSKMAVAAGGDNPSSSSSHHRGGLAEGGGGGRSLEKCSKQSRDSVLPAYSPKPPHRATPHASSSALPLLAGDDEYFNRDASSSLSLVADPTLLLLPPGTLGRKSVTGACHDGVSKGGGVSGGVEARLQTDRQTPHPPDYKEEVLGGKGGSLPPMPLPPLLSGGDLMPHAAALLANGRPPHAGTQGATTEKQRKEIFSKDTLFKPPPSMPLPGYSSLRKPCSGGGSSPSGGLAPPPLAGLSSSSCDALLLDSSSFCQDSAPKPLVASMPPPSLSSSSTALPSGGAGGAAGEASSGFDYYNVSDDDELDDAPGVGGGGVGGKGGRGADGKSLGGGGGGGTKAMMAGVAGGTMQWLLEREKERDLQRRFERNLTFPSSSSAHAKENSLPDAHHHHHHHHHAQQGAHSARLDSMDSSSVTVDSGFNSPRTRESLASNTSSIVESNRRQNQNLALSPGHLGMAPPPFSFRAIPPDPPAPPPPPDKLQKPNACLASITSV